MDPREMQLDELTEDDVLRVDPVREYDRRYQMREASSHRLAEVRDESDPIVTRGRPTGP